MLSLKAKHPAAIIFGHLGDLKDDFLLLYSEQKPKKKPQTPQPFHVDMNFYNTTLKPKQPQNSIDCTQDGNASKSAAARWLFSQKKVSLSVGVYTQALLFLARPVTLWGSLPPRAARGRARLGSAGRTRSGGCEEEEAVHRSDCVGAAAAGAVWLSHPR